MGRPHRWLLPALVSVAALSSVAVAPATVDRSPTCGLLDDGEACPRYETRYDGSAGTGDRAESVVLSPDGTTVYVGGYASGSGLDVLVAAFAADDGSLLWSDERDFGAGGDRIRDLALSADGTTLVAHGEGAGGAGTGTDLLTIAYDTATGTPRWERSYDGPVSGGDTGTAVDVSPDGQRIYASGYVADRSGNQLHYDGLTIAYDAATGAREWVVEYDGPAGWWDILLAQTVVLLPGGGDLVSVTMRSNVQSTSNDDTDVVTRTYDGATGAVVWEATYDGPAGSREYPYAMAASPDGSRIFVVAESHGSGTGFDYATLAYDAATGAPLWAARHDVQGGDDRPLAVAVSPDSGSVYLAGMGSRDFGVIDRTADVIAYEAATGTQRWSSSFDFEVGAAPSAVTVAPDGSRVYITGLVVGQAVGVGVGPVFPGYVTLNGILTVAYEATDGQRAWWARQPDPGSGRDVLVSPDGATVFVAGGGDDAVLLAYGR